MKRLHVRGERCKSGARWRAFHGAAPIAIALAMTPPALAQEQTFSFDIDSQPLASALLSFGRQADLSVLAPSALVEGKVAPQVRGQLSASAALEQLLDGSGLTFAFVQANAVRIVAKDQAALPPDVPLLQGGEGAGDRLVVTGTNIKGIMPVASPINVYTAEDIARTGATTTEQFIAKLPQNLGTFSQYAVGSTTASPNLDGVTSVDLRGLGVGTTLTLLNGRRMALSSSGRSADISSIPASAIARVEVLTDGASAIYGSDAIGGVINFVLRDDFEGAETAVSYGGVTSGGLRQGSASQTVGVQWSEGHGLASYNFHTASALKTSDRSYAAAAGPGNLTPVDTRHNLFATASHTLNDRFTVGFDLGGGWRKVKNAYSNLNAVAASQTFARYQSETDQVFGAIDLEYEFRPDLNARLTTSYAEVDTDGEVSIEQFNRVPPVVVASDFSARNSQLDVMGKLDGSLMALPAGNLRFSVGGGLLDETYKGVNPISSSQTVGALGRQSTYVFGEVFAPLVGPQQDVPLVHRLSLSLAARYTNYKETSSPSTGRDFGDSTDPKIGVLWAPLESLSFRGTYGSSFRAPSLTQLDPTAGTHYLFQAPVGGAPSIVMGMVGYAVPDLGPEVADSYTLGFDYADPAAPAFRFSATYYNIDYSGRIGIAPTGGLSPYGTPQLLPDLIYRPPSASFIEEVLLATPRLQNTSGVDLTDAQPGAAALFARNDVWVLDNRFKNLAVSQQDGLDVSLSHGFDTAWGDLQLGASLTHILSYKQQGSASSSVLDAVDIPGQPADWRGRAYATLSAGSFNGTIGVNYTDDYANRVAPAGQQTVDSWLTLDMNLTYDLGSDKRTGPRLSLSVQNLLDEDPPFLRPGFGSNIIYPVGFDPANANPLGRFVVVGLTQRW